MRQKLRGDVEIKGTGRTTTYWVHGDAQGGTPPPASGSAAAPGWPEDSERAPCSELLPPCSEGAASAPCLDLDGMLGLRGALREL